MALIPLSPLLAVLSSGWEALQEVYLQEQVSPFSLDSVVWGAAASRFQTLKTMGWEVCFLGERTL